MNDCALEAHLQCLPTFPLPGIVLFPHTILPLHIFEPRYRHMVRDARDGNLPIVMAQIDANAPPPRPGESAPVHDVAGVGVMRSIAELPDGRFLIELEGRARVRFLDELPQDKPYRRFRCELLGEHEPGPGALQQVGILRSMLLGLRGDNEEISAPLLTALSQNDAPQVVSYVAAHVLFDDSEHRQQLLEERFPERRMERIIDRLTDLLVPASHQRWAAN